MLCTDATNLVPEVFAAMLLIGEVAHVGACVVHNERVPAFVGLPRPNDVPHHPPSGHGSAVHPPKRRQVSSSNTQVGYDKLAQ